MTIWPSWYKYKDKASKASSECLLYVRAVLEVFLVILPHLGKKHYLVRDVITDHIIAIRYGLPPSNKRAELGFEAAWLQP